MGVFIYRGLTVFYLKWLLQSFSFFYLKCNLWSFSFNSTDETDEQEEQEFEKPYIELIYSKSIKLSNVIQCCQRAQKHTPSALTKVKRSYFKQAFWSLANKSENSCFWIHFKAYQTTPITKMINKIPNKMILVILATLKSTKQIPNWRSSPFRPRLLQEVSSLCL